MTICSFCDQYQKGRCQLGLNPPKTMSCREFLPGMAQFFADPRDFVGTSQIIQMAKFFGFQKTELKKIKLMATKEESARAEKKRFDSSAIVITTL